MSNGDWDWIRNNWKHLKGDFRQRWDEFSHFEVAEMNGDRDQIVTMIQEKYGIAEDEAIRQINEWADNLKVS